MAICKKIKRVVERVCIGSMNKFVKLKLRSIEFNDENDVDFNEFFQDTDSVWAMVSTVDGVQIFDSSNVIRSVTHDFYIRYDSNITSEHWLFYPAQVGNSEPQIFDIVKIENLNEENRFIKLRCNLRGVANVPNNWN